MKNTKPEFGISDHSPVDIATALHCYSRDMRAYYEMEHGSLVGQLDEATDDAEVMKINQKLASVNQKMSYFHVINNAASTVDLIMHTPLMVEECKQ
ncbi:MAG: hypothetical protein AAF528_10200 [Cyanobacteria bacterium P01_C01_bin.121]